MSYTHLSQEERYQIYALRRMGVGPTAIASQLQRSASTISRELRRNACRGGYGPVAAQRQADMRRAHNGRRISALTWQQVHARLCEDWSPEQIAGTLSGVSHESIYQHVYRDKAAGGTLYRHLRLQKQYRKRYGGGCDRRGQILGRRRISERPAVVNQRKRIGDWEGDTVYGAPQGAVLVSLVERRSQYLCLAKVKNRQSVHINQAIIQRLQPLSDVAHTLTLDNGKEFAGHVELEQRLQLECYFADPYAAWQRGLNEQVNGLLRQYFPKRKSLESVTEAELKHAMDRLNNRPRKTLGWKTPRQVLLAAAKRRGVALRI